jgi:hypothetical protein
MMCRIFLPSLPWAYRCVTISESSVAKASFHCVKSARTWFSVGTWLLLSTSTTFFGVLVADAALVVVVVVVSFFFLFFLVSSVPNKVSKRPIRNPTAGAGAGVVVLKGTTVVVVVVVKAQTPVFEAAIAAARAVTVNFMVDDINRERSE